MTIQLKAIEHSERNPRLIIMTNKKRNLRLSGELIFYLRFNDGLYSI